MSGSGTSEERLDAVEIKVSMGQGSTGRAKEALGLDDTTGTGRRIHFCEAAPGAAGDSLVPLLDQGVILRLRESTGNDPDSTVKLRPFDPGRLSRRWRDTFEVEKGSLKVEADWVGERHVVAASVVVRQGRGEVAEAASGRRSPAKLFSSAQEEFLGDYSARSVELDELRVLGPVEAVKWEPSERGFPRRLAAEHWKVDDLEFLEVSVRVDEPGEAEGVQQGLERFLGERGLLSDVVEETKTRTVLEYLSRR